jgi:hypothetical protein
MQKGQFIFQYRAFFKSAKVTAIRVGWLGFGRKFQSKLKKTGVFSLLDHFNFLT